MSRRYLLRGSAPLTAEEKEHFAALVHDRMTEQVRLRADNPAAMHSCHACVCAGKSCHTPCPISTPFASYSSPRLQVYPKPLSSFATDMAPAPVATIPVVAEGRAALERINKVGPTACSRGDVSGEPECKWLVWGVELSEGD